MSKSIMLKDNTFIDARGVNYNRQTLQSKLDDLTIGLGRAISKPVACNYNDWQKQQVIEGAGTGATIEGFDTTITTNGGNILVAISVPMSHSGGTCWLNIHIDGNIVVRYGVSHNVGLLAYTNVFQVSAGTHRVQVSVHNNNVQTVTIYNYTSKAFTVAEI